MPKNVGERLRAVLALCAIAVMLAAGGVLYTGGVAFYALNKIHYMHSVWHLFVLGGSICQYLSIALYVIPATF